MELSIDVTREGNDATVKLAGELDLGTAPDLQDALAELTGEPRRVVVNLEDLEFCDSTGLAALLGAHKTLTDNGGTLELLAPNRMLVNLVRITGLDEVFEVRLPDPKPDQGAHS